MIQNVILHLKTDGNEETDEKLLSEMLRILDRAKNEAFSDQKSNLCMSSAVRLPTGVHRVLKVMENSGYDDDFTFRAPSPFGVSQLRIRSSSTPSVVETGAGPLSGKRMSLPVSALSQESPMTASRSEDSLMELFGKRTTDAEMERFRSEDGQEVTKSVMPAAGRVGVRPLIGTPETLEEKMLRSLGGCSMYRS